jgi:branched-chain amino acid transport system permease protein
MTMLLSFAGFLLMQHVPYAVGFVLTVLIGLVFGASLYRVVIRRFANRPHFNVFIAILGLLLIFHALGASLFGPDSHNFPSPVGGGSVSVFSVNVDPHSIFVLGVSVVCMVLFYILFQRTRAGLALRATASDPTTAEMMGVQTTRTLALGWGLAGVMGAVAGMLLAPILTLTPDFMGTVLIAGLSAVVLGGLESAIGAVIGGVLIAITQNLVGTYVGHVFNAFGVHNINDPNAYRDVAVVLIMFLVLLLRPNGLFGMRAARNF